MGRFFGKPRLAKDQRLVTFEKAIEKIDATFRLTKIRKKQRTRFA
jgi:hypothetical protein